MVQAIAASIIFASVEVLRVVNVRVVLEASEIATALIIPPRLPVSLRLLSQRGC